MYGLYGFSELESNLRQISRHLALEALTPCLSRLSGICFGVCDGHGAVRHLARPGSNPHLDQKQAGRKLSELVKQYLLGRQNKTC